MEHRVSQGGGSCPVCRASLGLDALKVGDVWYCSSACAQGRTRAEDRERRVPEPWLYGRPRRFFRARKPRELKAGATPTRASR
jgi:hypothetical protein